MAKPRIAIIVGSNRRNWINRKLARALAKLGADKFDASLPPHRRFADVQSGP